MKFGAAWKKISRHINNYSAELIQNTKDASKNGKTITALQMRKIKFTVVVKKAKLAIRLLSNEFLFLLGPIAAALILVGAFIAIWRWKNNTKEQKKYNEGIKDLNKLIEELPKKVE